jgi:hypothetical protein
MVSNGHYGSVLVACQRDLKNSDFNSVLRGPGCVSK